MDRSGHSGVVDGRTAVRMDTDGDYTDGGSNFQVLRGATTVRPPSARDLGLCETSRRGTMRRLLAVMCGELWAGANGSLGGKSKRSGEPDASMRAVIFVVGAHRDGALDPAEWGGSAGEEGWLALCSLAPGPCGIALAQTDDQVVGGAGVDGPGSGVRSSGRCPCPCGVKGPGAGGGISRGGFGGVIRLMQEGWERGAGRQWELGVMASHSLILWYASVAKQSIAARKALVETCRSHAQMLLAGSLLRPDGQGGEVSADAAGKGIRGRERVWTRGGGFGRACLLLAVAWASPEERGRWAAGPPQAPEAQYRAAGDMVAPPVRGVDAVTANTPVIDPWREEHIAAARRMVYREGEGEVRVAATGPGLSDEGCKEVRAALVELCRQGTLGDGGLEVAARTILLLARVLGGCLEFPGHFAKVLRALDGVHPLIATREGAVSGSSASDEGNTVAQGVREMTRVLADAILCPAMQGKAERFVKSFSIKALAAFVDNERRALTLRPMLEAGPVQALVYCARQAGKTRENAVKLLAELAGQCTESIGLGTDPELWALVEEQCKSAPPLPLSPDPIEERWGSFLAAEDGRRGADSCRGADARAQKPRTLEDTRPGERALAELLAACAPRAGDPPEVVSSGVLFAVALVGNLAWAAELAHEGAPRGGGAAAAAGLRGGDRRNAVGDSLAELLAGLVAHEHAAAEFGELHEAYGCAPALLRWMQALLQVPRVQEGLTGRRAWPLLLDFLLALPASALLAPLGGSCPVGSPRSAGPARGLADQGSEIALVAVLEAALGAPGAQIQLSTPGAVDKLAYFVRTKAACNQGTRQALLRLVNHLKARGSA